MTQPTSGCLPSLFPCLISELLSSRLDQRLREGRLRAPGALSPQDIVRWQLGIRKPLPEGLVGYLLWYLSVS